MRVRTRRFLRVLKLPLSRSLQRWLRHPRSLFQTRLSTAVPDAVLPPPSLESYRLHPVIVPPKKPLHLSQLLRSFRDRSASLFDEGSGLHLVRLITSGIWLLCHLLTSVPSPLPLLIKTLFRMEPQVRQISPDKNMNCHCTTSSFTIPREPMGFVMLC